MNVTSLNKLDTLNTINFYLNFKKMIPREVLKILISYLPLESLLQFSRVSKDFKLLCNTTRLVCVLKRIVIDRKWECIAFEFGVYKDPKPMKPFMPRMKTKPTKEQSMKHREALDKYKVVIEEYNLKVFDAFFIPLM